MAFTGVLGSLDSSLGSFALGRLGVTPPDFDPHVTHTLNLTQSVVVLKTLNVSASNTLSLTQVARYFTPLVPLVGYSGGQTRYCLVRDITLGQDLYQLNPDTLFDYPASITKLMTSLLIWEYKNTVLDTDFVTVTTADLTDPSGFTFSTGGFANGDVISWRGLLTSIHVASASDACQTAARIIGHEIYVAAGSTGLDGMARFVAQMNIRAGTLGLTNTTYFDPWGASRTGSTIRNQTTARDTATLTEATIGSIPTIAGMAGLPSQTWPVTGPGARTLTWTADDRLVNGPSLSQAGIKDTNIVGGKPGEWLANGDHYCLTNVWTAPSGNQIVIVTHNAQSWLELTYDQYAIIHSILKDWPYLEVIPTAGDPFYSNVKLLMGADGSIVDESNSHRMLTPTSVTVGAGIVAQSSGAAVYNANSDSISAADSPDLTIGSGDATIEFWFAGGAVPGGGTELLFLSKYNVGTGTKELALNYYQPSRTFGLFISLDGTNWQSISAFSLSAEQEATFFNGAPRHIAVVRSGTSATLYIGGERSGATIGSVTTIADISEPLVLGFPSGTNSPIGSFDEFRFSKGIARYSLEKVTIAGRAFSRVQGGDVAASSHLNLTQSVHVNVTYNRTVEHTLTLVGHAYKVTDVVASSTLTLTQAATVKKVRNVACTSTLTLSQTLTREMTYNRSVNQGLALVHRADRLMSYDRRVTSPLALTGVATGIASKTAKNTLVLSQTATYQYVKGARSELTLTQTTERSMTYNRPLFSVLGLFQRVTVNGTFHKTSESVLTLSQLATVQVVKGVKHTLNLTQVATCDKVTPAFSFLSIYDYAQVSITSNQRVSQVLILNQSVTVQHSKSVHASNVLGLNQFARATKVINVAASNVLNLTQELVQQRFIRDVSQTLNLTQSATCQKISTRAAASVLALSHDVGLSKTINRSVHHTLIFTQTHERRTGISSFPVVSVPSAQVTVTKRCVLILQSAGLTVTLPCPEFNDKEAGTSKLNIKRAMDGTRRIYRRESPTTKLTYDLVMDRRKAIELRNFLIVNNSTPIYMTNHKGELWFVLITNSPFTFTEAAFWDSSWGNKSTITLELEGTRLN